MFSLTEAINSSHIAKFRPCKNTFWSIKNTLALSSFIETKQANGFSATLFPKAFLSSKVCLLSWISKRFIGK